MHFPAGKASHTPITGKKENCPKGESTKGLPLLQETGTANSLAELSASAELGFSKVSAEGQKWRGNNFPSQAIFSQNQVEQRNKIQ